jgi:hypothetical protein
LKAIAVKQNQFAEKIFTVKPSEFEQLALEIFRFQAKENPLYATYISQLGVFPDAVVAMNQIPFLPVSFFKSHKIISGGGDAAVVFSSSGTTGTVQSQHYVTDGSLYERSFREGFRFFYGAPEGYCILALLPSYLEREGSSLIYMVQDLIEKSKNPDSGFYLNDLEGLSIKLQQLSGGPKKIILIGVSFALLDLAALHPVKIPNAIVMETGGMKGKRKEMVREELHEELCRAFGVRKIHSEYGMTELLSQAYSDGDGCFACPPWMRVLLRDTRDPLTHFKEKTNTTGGISIIDLANINSCSFIATEDLGRMLSETTFEVLGRFDSSDLRGCNLLVG